MGNGRMIEVSKRLAPWRNAVAAATRAVMRGRQPFGGPVAITLEFVMPRPVSLPKRMPTPPAIKRPDVDKLARSCLDAIVTGAAIVDDSQAVDLRATKRIAEIGERPGVVIEIADLSHHTDYTPNARQRGNQAAKTASVKEPQP